MACWVFSGKLYPESLPDFSHLSSKGSCSNFRIAEAEGCSHMRIVFCLALRKKKLPNTGFKLQWELGRSSGGQDSP